ncbi:MAG: tRNA lysidine(34) synthetase TilS [Flavobacteriales bacterium]|nr:tRNA lysidine(34) synthetase TilS [Flavobacteriales bacterium]
MQSRFIAALDSFGYSNSIEVILVAVSGGVDSMVLASLMNENGFKIAVAHCNYQLRGADSDSDEKLVRDWCVERQIPFHSRHVATQELVDATNDSIQMVARNARYAFFSELIEQHSYATTALAHNLDDRIESLLINVLRGTGFRGLQGMPSQRKGLIRPLIGISKQEIREYAKENEIPYREDVSNSETYYLRNWVRLRLLPMLNQADPDAFSKLKELTERAEKEMSQYEKWVNAQLSEIRSDNGLYIDGIHGSKAPFTLLKEFLKPKGFSSDQVFEVLDIMNSESGREVVSETHKLIKDRTQLIVAEKDSSEDEPILHFELLERSEIKSFKESKNVALIDAELVGAGNVWAISLSSIFVLRKWRQGDRFQPLGMKGWKKLSDFFIDEKLSMIEKEQVWLLTSGNEIVWVVGHRIDDRFKVSENTKKVLKIMA